MRTGASELSLRAKVTVLAFANAIVVCAALVLGFLGLPLLFVAWNLSIMAFILIWEREEAGREVAREENNLAEERTTKFRVALADVEKRLSANPTAEKSADLKKRRSWLLSQQRRLKWSLKEEELESLTRAAVSTGPSLRHAAHFHSLEAEGCTDDEENLKRIVRDAESIISREPKESLQYALKPVLNEITALHNAIRRRDSSSPVLLEYWAAWAVIKSIEGELGTENLILRTPKPLRRHLARLMKASMIRNQRMIGTSGQRTDNTLLS